MADGGVRRVWVRAEVDEDRAQLLGKTLGLSPRVARLLVARGIFDADTAARYLEPNLTHLPNPMAMKGVDVAAERLADAIEHGEQVTLYGDYDVDGVTSTALLASFLGVHGLPTDIYIPRRLVEGYGLNEEAVETLAGRGTEVLVTLDCGITAADEIARANERGIDCIVVDHHKCPPALPPALATLNPQQDDCAYEDSSLAAVGVCFNLIVALRKVLRERGHYSGANGGIEEPNLRRFLDLVALGTIADMVPLMGANRTLTWFGLEELRWAQRPGIRALMEVSRVVPSQCGSGDVGFRLGPRINAAGRLDDASVGVRLLLADDVRDARRLAEALDSANQDRQRIEADVFASAVEAVESGGALPAAIVLANSEWHPGVVGIVASKIVERYDRPAVLIGEGGRGSARTARGLHLYDAIRDVSEHLIKFGGHRAAAGLRIAADRIDNFREDLVRRVASDEGYRDRAPVLVYDDDLHPHQIDDRCYDELRRLEPFGNGNPEPLFRAGGVRVRSARVVGRDHLKLRLMEGAQGGMQAIAFKRAELCPSLPQGAAINLAFHLERNEFNGNASLEMRVRDLELAEGETAPALDPPP